VNAEPGVAIAAIVSTVIAMTVICIVEAQRQVTPAFWAIWGFMAAICLIACALLTACACWKKPGKKPG
jgi:hypothetical protein